MTTEIQTANNGGLPAQYTDEPFAAYGAAASGNAFLKFDRGIFKFGQDGDELPIGTRLVPNMPEVQVGHLKWKDGEVVDEAMMPLGAGYRPAARPELGDTDESLWDADEDGKPIDPWPFTNTIPFKNPATGQEFTFTTSSRGGTSAVGKLCSVYGQQRQQHEGQLPIIELQTSSYRHKRFGEVYIPVLRLVGWQCEAELSSSGAAEPDLNDDLPPGF